MQSPINKLRGEVFRKAYKRANRAIKAGFYLEAIAICDSLASDRLREILRSNVNYKVGDLSVGQCLSHLKDHKIAAFDDDLFVASKDWVQSRNKFMHSMGQLTDFESISWLKRLRIAKSVAGEGLKLVNRLSKESRKHSL